MSTLDTATDTSQSAPMRTYRTPAVIMHWFTALLVFCMIASGVIAKQLGEGDLANTLMSLHKLTGFATLVLIVLRVLYRAFSSAPEWGARLQRRPVLHWGLYAIVIFVPLLGWAGISDFGAREVAFGIVLPPIWPEGAGYDEILLSPVQGYVRWWVYLFWTGTEAPEALKRAVYFTFVFGFATLRLWGTVAILIVALRESYRRAGPAPVAGKT